MHVPSATAGWPLPHPVPLLPLGHEHVTGYACLVARQPAIADALELRKHTGAGDSEVTSPSD